MNTAEAFMQGKIKCEVEGCTLVSTHPVQDLGHLFDQGSIAVSLIPIGPMHFLCDLHKRDHYDFEKVNDQWVRF